MFDPLHLRPLTPITNGRIFVRDTGSGFGYVGVVEAPSDLAPEHLYGFRMNSGLWLDASQKEHGDERMGYTRLGRRVTRELDINNLLTSMKFKTGALTDAQEFFVRYTMLPNSAPDKAWCFIAGASEHRNRYLSKDGLYELSEQGPIEHLETDPNLGVGTNLGQLLREPLWGDSGQFGLAHSMDPDYFPLWVESDRKNNSGRDPDFGKFMEMMKAHGEPPLFYTATQKAEREQLTRTAIRAIKYPESLSQHERPRG